MDIKTDIFEEPVNYGRTGAIGFENDIIWFDTSDGEYGCVEFPISIFEEKLKEHKSKLLANDSN